MAGVGCSEVSRDHRTATTSPRDLQHHTMPFASVNGRELFTVSVPGTGETADNERVGFLFIHGLGSAHSFYFPAISELTASGYDSVAYDTYGSSSLLPYFDGGSLELTQALRQWSVQVQGGRAEREVHGPGRSRVDQGSEARGFSHNTRGPFHGRHGGLRSRDAT